MSVDALSWCRERMMVPGQPLAASLLFIDEADRPPILALRTVAAEITALGSAHSDPALMQAKAAWWHDALVQADSSHPALKALGESGACARLSASDFQPLLSGVQFSLSNPRFERFEELWRHCRATGGELAHLEWQLKDDGQSAEAARDLGAAACLIRLVRDLSADARHNRWLVPLDLQAQFQVGRADALELSGGPGWDGLVRTLLERALHSGERAAGGLDATHRHLHILWALDRRLALVLSRRPGRILRQRILIGHASNVWTAWRAARRLENQPRG